MERDPLPSTTLRVIRSARSGLGQSFRSFLCPTPKVTPRSSLGDVGEAVAAVAQMDRYESYLARYGIRYAQSRPRGVALLVEPPLGVRPTLPAVRGSSQLAALAESLVTDAERSNRRVTCLLHIISDGTRVRHAKGITLSILRAFIACAATVQTAVLVLFGPSCSGHYRPLQCF